MTTKGKILLVEDNKTDRMILRKQLENAGYKVCTVRDGKEAVRAIRRNDIDLIVMDYFLPELNADQVLAEAHTTVPVLIVSGLDDMKAACDLMRRGVADILPKGGEDYPANVVVRVNAILRGARRRRLAAKLLMVSTILAALLVTIYAIWVQHLYQAAENRRAQWREIIEDSHTALIVCTEDGRIEDWNYGAERLLGWTRSEALGSSLRLIIPPDRYRKHLSGINDPRVRDRLLRGEVFLINGYVLNNEGKVLHVNIRLKSVHNGRVIYVAEIALADNVEELPKSEPPSQSSYAPPDLRDYRYSPEQQR